MVLLIPAFVRSDTWVVREPSAIQDVALRDGEYASWNFGGGPMLQVGCLVGSEASAYQAVSLIRFDLSAVPCKEVRSAKLRLYKPRCFVQQAPVDVAVFEVAAANRDWAEGSSECIEERRASCWRFKTDGKPWAGQEGCSKEGVDYIAPAPDVRTARDDRGQWLEFSVPAALARKWIDHPEANAGLLLRPAKPSDRWGEHVFFYSSEHYSGKGPQLLIEGTPGEPKRAASSARSKAVHKLPADGPKFDRWLASNRRLAGFARKLGLDREQARVFFHMDTTVRDRLLIGRYQMPIAKLNPRIEAVAAKGDEPEVRRLLCQFRRAILTYEYIHDTQWYTAGPLAEVLSSLQIGKLYAVCLFGRMEEHALERGTKIWWPATGEKLDKAVRDTFENVKQKLELSAEQSREIEPRLAELKRKEQRYLAAFRADFDRAKTLVAGGSNDDQLFRLMRSMFFNHEAFLYYQSIYVAPRWQLFLEKAPIIPFGRWIVEVRKNHYAGSRIERELRETREFE